MKNVIFLFLSFAFFKPQAQVIPAKKDSHAGNRIWFYSYSLNPDSSLGKPFGNFQAEILKGALGQMYIAVVSSGDWTSGIRQYPSSLPLYETPENAVQVVLDYPNKQFQFFLWNANPFSEKPHHVNSVLNFVGYDSLQHSITFSDFVGR
jgi:hypothetical protein